MKNHSFSAFLLALVLSNTFGCGDQAYVRHAQVAFSLYGVNEAAVPLIERVCHERAVEAASNPDVTTEQATNDTARVLENCRAVVQYQHRFAEQHRIWMTTAAMASGNPERLDVPRSTALLYQLYDIYVELSSLLSEQFDVTIPQIPRLVLRFLVARGE